MHRSLIAMLIAATQVVASPIPDFPFTAVYGSATDEVAPDQATIKFTVLCHDPRSEVAVATVNEVLTKVVEGLVGLGIKKEDLVADDLSKEAVREKGDDYKRLKILGYDVSRDVKVTVAEIERYTAVVRLIMATDNITRVSTEFDTSKRDEIESTLMASACANAKRKAKLLCEGVGTDLGEVFAVSDQDFTGLPGRFGFGYSGAGDALYSALPPLGDEDEVPVFVPTKIDVRASVNVLYRLASTTKREQAGAGQPATRSESNSEGKDNPQPEAEGRSR
jgi:hypothetical protein